MFAFFYIYFILINLKTHEKYTKFFITLKYILVHEKNCLIHDTQNIFKNTSQTRKIFRTAT